MELFHKSGELKSEKTFDAETNTSAQHTIYKSSKPFFLLKDIQSNELLLSSSVSIRLYLTSDTLHPFDWHVHEDVRKDTLGYACYKASTHFRGRDYTAWFTPDIPIPFGPWKFGGLPGLIIHLHSNDNLVEYTMLTIDFEVDFDESIFTVPAEYDDDTIFSHQDYIELDNKWKERLHKRSGIEETGTLEDGRTTRSIGTFWTPARIELY